MQKLLELLKNKTILYSLIGGVVLVVVLVVCLAVFAPKHGADSEELGNKPIEADVNLLTTDNLGKALEVQALLARYNITATREMDGTKSKIVLKAKDKIKKSQRDQALLIIVQSGLMDQYTGLEIFDKGDFTSTKEDKRIRLVRAINGELSRLIRKIPPIENASVFVSIPEQTMFTSDRKPVTATVQLVVPSGVRLEQSKIKAVENLLLGSVSGLTSDYISITDTNGNVYSSLINALDDQIAKLQENDSYMQNKVSAQLDRLVGKGNYVVTVSTFLRQTPSETTRIEYDPNSKTSLSEQTFSEGLGDSSSDKNSGSGAVSVYVPEGVPTSSSSSSQDRKYSRSAQETQYGVSKSQTSEYIKQGIIEDITIAVTLEASAKPTNISEEELKNIIAKAASPKVNPDNVSIAYSQAIQPYLSGDKAVNLPKPDESGNPWWVAIVLLVGGLIFGFIFVSRRLRATSQRQKEELDKLREKSEAQDKQIMDVNLKAAELTEKQDIISQQLIEQNKKRQLERRNSDLAAMQISETLEDISDDITYSDEAETIEKIKNWIERS